MLYNVKVLGLYTAKDGEQIEAFPAVIDKDTFYLARDALQKKKTDRIRQTGNSGDQFLQMHTEMRALWQGFNQYREGNRKQLYLPKLQSKRKMRPEVSAWSE